MQPRYTEANAVERILGSGSFNEISDFVSQALTDDLDRASYLAIIDAFENQFLQKKSQFLSTFLFFLFDKIGDTDMARFYLQYCYDDLSRQSKYSSLINKYVSGEPDYIGRKVSLYNEDFTYQFEGETRSYSVHSFSNRIGQNLTLLKTPYGSILFDCGAKISGGRMEQISEHDLRNFLAVYQVPVSNIRAVLISHAHLDHYGSICSLQGVGIPPWRFCTDSRTREIIRVASGDDLLEDALPVSAFSAPDLKLQIHAFDNGHIVGSQAYAVRFDNVTVLYTGDFCLHDQLTVKGWDIHSLKQDPFIAAGVNCLITESTYGDRPWDILPYDSAVKAFEHLTSKLSNLGIKTFLPAFAIGRSQELALMLNQKHRVLVDGLSTKMCQIYDELTNSKIMNGQVRFPFGTSNCLDNFDLNDFIIASSGMLTANSTSAAYIESLLDSDEKSVLIQTGYMDSSEESYGNELLRRWSLNGRLRLNISLSAHACYHEITHLITEISPESVVAIHGNGLKVRSQPKNDSSVTDVAPQLPADSNRTGSNPADLMLQQDGKAIPASVQRHWRNMIKLGSSLQERGVALANSQSFRNAHKLLLKLLRQHSECSSILDTVNCITDYDKLLHYLTQTEKNGFLSTPVSSDGELPVENNENIPSDTSTLSLTEKQSVTNAICLRDIADVFSGVHIPKEKRQSDKGDYCVIAPKHITGHTIIFSKKNTYYCSADTIANDPFSDTAILRPGDVVVRIARGNWSIVKQLPTPSIANYNILVIRAKPSYMPLLHSYFESGQWDDAFSADLSLSEIGNLKIAPVCLPQSCGYPSSDGALHVTSQDILDKARNLVSYAHDIGYSSNRLAKSVLFEIQLRLLLDDIQKSDEKLYEEIILLGKDYSSIVARIEKAYCSEVIP